MNIIILPRLLFAAFSKKKSWKQMKSLCNTKCPLVSSQGQFKILFLAQDQIIKMAATLDSQLQMTVIITIKPFPNTTNKKHV